MGREINFERLDYMLNNFRSSNGKSTWFVYESEVLLTQLNKYLEEMSSPVSYGAFLHRVKDDVFEYKGYKILTPEEVKKFVFLSLSNKGKKRPLLHEPIKNNNQGIIIEETIVVKKTAKISISLIRDKFNLENDVEIKIIE